jgi:hypothetical protein
VFGKKIEISVRKFKFENLVTLLDIAPFVKVLEKAPMTVNNKIDNFIVYSIYV